MRKPFPLENEKGEKRTKKFIQAHRKKIYFSFLRKIKVFTLIFHPSTTHFKNKSAKTFIISNKISVVKAYVISA